MDAALESADRETLMARIVQLEAQSLKSVLGLRRYALRAFLLDLGLRDLVCSWRGSGVYGAEGICFSPASSSGESSPASGVIAIPSLVGGKN
jgi:hypothetical protein